MTNPNPACRLDAPPPAGGVLRESGRRKPKPADSLRRMENENSNSEYAGSENQRKPRFKLEEEARKFFYFRQEAQIPAKSGAAPFPAA